MPVFFSGANREVTIIENARVYTMDRDPSKGSAQALPRAEALAFVGARILAVGSTEDVRQAAGSDARRVDAGGKAIVPGLIDAHIHVLSYARGLNRVDLDGVKSKDAALAMVSERARQVGPGRWVLGGGWNNNLWSPPNFPTRHDLDRAAPHNPVFLPRKDMHSAWVNTMALARAGITPETPDPPGAAIGRDEAGEPNGMLFESATHLAERAVDEPEADSTELLRHALSKLASMGLTGLHAPEGPDSFAALQQLDATGDLKLRVVIFLPYYRLHEAIRLGLRTGFGSDRLRVGPVKIFSDGSLGSQTAEMLEPFEGSDNLGIGTIPQDELEEAIMRASAAGIPSAIHAIGDAANRRVLDAFEKSMVQSRRSKVSSTDLRPSTFDFGLIHRIEHAQLLHPDDLPRFANLGVVASMQPIHATSDMRAADRLWGRRARYGYAWKSLIDAGALVAFGSDAPVETPNPFVGIHAAVTRQDADGLPEGGWYPEERLTVVEAVRAYTQSATRSAPYLPGVTGTLSPGAAADLLVLDRDIFTIEPGEIKDARPVATVIGGDAVYDSEEIFS